MKPRTCKRCGKVCYGILCQQCNLKKRAKDRFNVKIIKKMSINILKKYMGKRIRVRCGGFESYSGTLIDVNESGVVLTIISAGGYCSYNQKISMENFKGFSIYKNVY